MTHTGSALADKFTVATAATSAQCEACGSEGMVPFYELPGVPVHSVLLMRTLESAVGYSRGDISLAYCPACGFVSNVAFDESFNDYGQQYEETQGFSPTFSTFHRRLVRQLVDRYDISNKMSSRLVVAKGNSSG